MNFLAHLHLARPDRGSQVGAILGDFVRGTPEVLARTLPADIVDGIRLHRAIDRWTDTHPAFLDAKTLLPTDQRRFAGITLDLIFDHFLSRDWATFSDVLLPSFCEQSYDLLEKSHQHLPRDLQALLPRMRRENWLLAYRTEPDLERSLLRTSHRRPYLAPLAHVFPSFQQNRAALHRHFLDLYPDLQDRAAAFR